MEVVFRERMRACEVQKWWQSDRWIGESLHRLGGERECSGRDLSGLFISCQIFGRERGSKVDF